MGMQIRTYADGRVVYVTVINGIRQIWTVLKDGRQYIRVEKVNG